ncbi:Ribosome-binding factor A [bioreactor metagenome]|uniref:Ribosome-binding factor A n=1 Tax=bioreactor metagenome TaxID=1076179 RepID=A0A644ZM21_9ZZZZ|nr:ribosome-binding factor A [Paludibacter sp.]
MESKRQEKIARMLQKELGEIFMLYAKKMQGIIISVTNVKVSPDLSITHNSLSVFPSEKGRQVLDLVKQDTKSIRFELGKRVRNQLRIIPELVFHLDDSLDYLERIDSLLKSDPPSPISEEEN